MPRTWLITGAAAAHGGRIDVIISNAGRGTFGAAEELTDAEITTRSRSTSLPRSSSPGPPCRTCGRRAEDGSCRSRRWAAFGVEITIVEPGAARTGFGRALTVARALEAYAGTPVGQMRAYIESAGDLTGQAPGDPGKIAQAIIDSADVSPAPLRLPLGSDAYAAMHGAISGRLAQLEAARQTALSTDVDARSGAGAVTHSGREN